MVLEEIILAHIDSGEHLSKDKNLYNLALGEFDEAIVLSKDSIGGEYNLNPDYLAIALSGKAWLTRRANADKETSLDLINEAISAVANSSTYYGLARALEEKALVYRYMPSKETTLDDLLLSLKSIRKSIEHYNFAVEKHENEIISLEKLNDRYARAQGIASTIASEISKVTGSENYREEAIRYAREEVRLREANKETTGSPLANAYHTLGVALTDIADNNAEIYREAENSLSKAQNITEDPQTSTVIQYRFASLEMAYNPENTLSIGNSLNNYLNRISTLDKGVKNVLRDGVFRIAEYLGEDILKKTQEAYR